MKSIKWTGKKNQMKFFNLVQVFEREKNRRTLAVVADDLPSITLIREWPLTGDELELLR